MQTGNTTRERPLRCALSSRGGRVLVPIHSSSSFSLSHRRVCTAERAGRQGRAPDAALRL